MARPSVTRIAQVKEQAAAGVDYSPRLGARCPWCGKRARIYATQPWIELTRIRYHRCENGNCVLAATGISIKSIEVDG
ncbi:MAG: hypothetical protein VR65_24955 [Desulfobulbaceae bacterium BRH_c16a]|nr:MAG: hypothetical protein VR65_24955 [Desulfobulbaceae bacterium BRH_c16a]